jgi:hypothetical protein
MPRFRDIASIFALAATLAACPVLAGPNDSVWVQLFNKADTNLRNDWDIKIRGEALNQDSRLATIFVLFVPADASLEFRVSAFAVVAVDGLLGYGLAALLFSRETLRRVYLTLRRPIDRLCGALMMIFAGKLAMMQN